MSLATNISDLATRIGTELKAVRTLVNGNAAGLSGLATTDKSSLLGAINEVAGKVATAAGINDTTPSTSTTYSSSKTESLINAANTANRARANHTGTQSADTLTDGSTNKAFLATERTKLASVANGATANATDAALRDRTTHTGTQPVATLSDFAGAVDARIESRLGTAPANLDTLTEIADRLGQDSDALAALTTGLASRVRFDAAQTLTAAQATQARANIGAQDAASIGNTATDYVAAFNAALV